MKKAKGLEERYGNCICGPVAVTLFFTRPFVYSGNSSAIIVIYSFVEETGPVFSEGFDTNTATPLDYFYMLFPIQLLSEIVTFTNGYAK